MWSFTTKQDRLGILHFGCQDASLCPLARESVAAPGHSESPPIPSILGLPAKLRPPKAAACGLA